MKFDVLSTFQQQNETTTAYMNQILVFEKMPEEAELADKSHQIIDVNKFNSSLPRNTAEPTMYTTPHVDPS